MHTPLLLQLLKLIMASESPVLLHSQSPNTLGHLICSRGGDHLLQNPRLLPCLHRFCADCFTEEVMKQVGPLLQQGLEESPDSLQSSPNNVGEEDPIEFTCPVIGCNERTGIFMHRNGHVTNSPWSPSLQNMLDSLLFEKRLLAGEELCGDCPESNRQVAIAACIDEDHFDIPLCQECLQRHKTATSSSNHKVVHVDNLKQRPTTNEEQTPRSLHHRAPICHIHPDQRIRMYCPEHSTVVCLVCASTALEEGGHEGCRGKFDVNVDAANRHIQDEFDTELRGLGELHEEFEFAIHNTKSVKRSLAIRSDAVQREINIRFDELKTRLEQRRNELINQTEEICRLKTEALDHHLEMLNDNINIIKESLVFIREFKSTAIPAELFFVKTQVERRMKSLRHRFKYYTRVKHRGGSNQHSTQPRVNPDPVIYNDIIHYDINNLNIEQGMGSVYSTPCLNNFEILGTEFNNTILRLKFILKLECRDIYGTHLSGELPSLQAILIPHGTVNLRHNRDKVRNGVYCSIQSNSLNGTYFIQFPHNLPGRYKLYISYPHPPPFFSHNNQGKVIPLLFRHNDNYDIDDII